MHSDCWKQHTMSAQLPRPSASAGSAMSGRAVICGKMGIATQRQRERAMLLAQVDKSRKPAIDKTLSFNRATPATPSSVERAHRLLQRSAMKQVDVRLRASTLSPVFELPVATIPELSPTVEILELPATVPELPPTVEQVAGGEHVGGGGSGKKDGGSMPRDDLLLNQDTDPSTPLSKSVQGKTHDDKDDPYYRCAAHRLCLSMGDQTSQLLMCINCNQPLHLFCAEYLMEQKPVNKDPTFYISVRDFTKEGRARYKKTSSSEKDNVVFCILCSAKMKAVKVSAKAVKLAKLAGKHQSANTGKAAPKKEMRSTNTTTGIIRELRRVAAFQAQLFIFTRVEKTKADLRYSLIEEKFHGCPHKCIKGACAQLIEGSGAFRLLYDVREGEDDVEFVLKPSCCGKETSSS